MTMVCSRLLRTRVRVIGLEFSAMFSINFSFTLSLYPPFLFLFLL